jgi:hypothetical protein
MEPRARLINVTLDADSFAIEMEINGTFYRVEKPITSIPSIQTQRFLMNEIVPTLFTFGDDSIDLEYIEPNDDELTYDE